MARLGGPIFETYSGPDEWVRAVRKKRYGAAYCPVGCDAENGVVESYARAAADADIVIAEVGAWSNPLSPDEQTRRDALENCRRSLELAERIGARCCVNIAGSRGPMWHGPNPWDLSDEGFDAVVESVRDIIDAVNPTRSFYSLEAMPWMFPDSPETYRKLIDAIDRKGFAVHLDPVNMINSPRCCFDNARIISECFRQLGPWIRSCHGKDIVLEQGPCFVRFQEVRPGTGCLDYEVFLRELSTLDADTPLMLEHLSTEEEYDLAAEHVREVARRIDVAL